MTKDYDMVVNDALKFFRDKKKTKNKTLAELSVKLFAGGAFVDGYRPLLKFVRGTGEIDLNCVIDIPTYPKIHCKSRSSGFFNDYVTKEYKVIPRNSGFLRKMFSPPFYSIESALREAKRIKRHEQ